MPRLRVPEELPADDLRELARYCRRDPALRRYLRKGPGGLRALVSDCLDHYRSRGNPHGYTDWLAVCRTWVRRQARFDAERRTEQHRTTTGDPTRLFDLFREIAQRGEAQRKALPHRDRD